MKKLIVLVLFTSLTWMYRGEIEIKLEKVKPKVTALYNSGINKIKEFFKE